MFYDIEQEIKGFREVLQILHDGYILVREDGTIVDVNPAYCKMIGYSREELLSMGIHEVREDIPKESHEKFIKQVLKKGSADFEAQHRTKEGQTIDLKVSAATVEKNGKCYLAGFIRDITTEKESKRKAEKRKQKFQSLFQHNPNPVYLYDLEGSFIMVNDKLVSFTGKSKEELLSMSFVPFIHEEDLEDTLDNFQKAVSGEVREYELRVFVHDGIEKEVRVTKFPMYEGDEIKGVYGILQDITIQKKNKRELKESEERWQMLVESNPQCVVIIADAKVEYINEAGVQLMGGAHKDEIIGKPASIFTTSDYQEQLSRRLENFSKKLTQRPVEYVLTGLRGKKRTVRVHSVPITYKGKNAIQSVLHDVTALKNREKRLKESEQKWQHLVEDNPHPVLVTHEGIIFFINEAGARLYGAGASDEIVGTSIFEFKHSSKVEAYKRRLEKLEKGEPVKNMYEHQIVRKDDKKRTVVEHSISIVYQDKPAIQTVLYDITDRKEKEAIIESSLKEKEVMLKEIHHRVKNNMAVISGLLELQTMNIGNVVSQNILQESQLRIFSMAMIHEKLYQSETLSNIDFDIYAKELVKSIQDTVGKSENKVKLMFDVQPVNLDINQSIPCALILNELVVNSFKHAFTGRKEGILHISIHLEDQYFTMTVEDDGCGLPNNFNMKEQKSLGMTLIQTLTKQLEGDLFIENVQKGKGTKAQICFKKTAAKSLDFQ